MPNGWALTGRFCGRGHGQALAPTPASDAASADHGPWRVDQHDGIHVYAGAVLVATMAGCSAFARANAARAAADHSAVPELAAEIARFRRTANRSSTYASPDPQRIA